MINGNPYQLDITHDKGKTGGQHYAIRYDYFNIPDEDALDRSWNDKQAVWICRDRKYSYVNCVGGLVKTADDTHRYIYKELKNHKLYLYIKLAGELLQLKN